MSINGNASNGLHMVMFPYLAFGHISPFIRLARRLTSADPSIRITFISAPGNVLRINSLLSSCASRIHVVSIPLPTVPGLPLGIESTADLTSAQAELLKLAVDAMRPDVSALLSKLTPHFVMYDFAMPWIPSIAAPLGVKSLFFTVCSAMADSYLMVPSRRGLQTVDDLRRAPPGFPATSAIASGVPSYQAHNFTYVYRKFDEVNPCVYDRFVGCMTACDGVVARTCMEMEGQYVSYMEAQYMKPVLLAGPAVPEPPSDEKLEERWSGWLNRFEPGSVIYCCFGSETFLSEQGVGELVLGLEMTGLPFLVVLNCLEGEEAMRERLPVGFESRVKGRGVVHQGWVQQQLILLHESVGCFVSHAGLSTVFEGLVAGCQLVMIPQRGDQFMNAALSAGDLGIGVEVERDEGGGFGRKGVCEAVKRVMMHVGQAQLGERSRTITIREKHKKWREFLMDKEVDRRFTGEFVHKLKALV